MTVKKVGISINGKRIDKYFKTYLDGLRWKHRMIVKYSDPSLPNEIWKHMPGFSRYEASIFGRLRSLNYKDSGLRKVLKPSLSGGYLKTMLKADSCKYKTWNVHKFITMTFFGECPEGKEVNHKDGNKLNNYITNLEYVTRLENVKHCHDNGLQEYKRGVDVGTCKLTESQVLTILKKKKEGGRFWGRNNIAKEFGITEKHVQDIANNSAVWTHLK